MHFRDWNLASKALNMGLIFKILCGPVKLPCVILTERRNLVINSNLSRLIICPNMGVSRNASFQKYYLCMGVWIIPISVESPVSHMFPLVLCDPVHNSRPRLQNNTFNILLHISVCFVHGQISSMWTKIPHSGIYSHFWSSYTSERYFFYWKMITVNMLPKQSL